MGILLDSAADIYSAKNNLVEIPAGGDPLQYWDDTAANQVRNLAVEVHAALRGQLDTGKHFVGMGDNAADPDMLASLGAGVSYIYGTVSVAKRKRSGSGGLTTMLDSVGDNATSSSGTDRPWSLAPVVNQSGTAGYTAWQVNVTETATGSGSKLLFDWQVGGTSKLRAWNTGSLDFGAGSSAAVSASGRGAIRFDEGTNVFQQSVNGGAWVALGGGVTDTDNVTWTGTHSFEGASFNVNPLATFAAGLNLTGTLAVTGGATISTTLGLATGSAAAPALYHATGSDTDTGVYFAADMVGLTTAGTSRFTINSTVNNIAVPVNVPAGSAGTPSFGFGTDTNTGAYSVGADQYGITTGGTLRLTVSTTLLTSTLAMLGPDGTISVPTWGFASDPTTGIYRSGSGTVSITTAGALAHSFSATNTLHGATTATTNAVVSMFEKRLNTSGTAAVGFGMADRRYLENASGTDIECATESVVYTNATAASETADWVMALRSAGSLVERGRLTGAGAWQVGAGSASLPSLSFTGDTNTGFLSTAADAIGVSIGGTERFKFDGSRLSAKFGSGAYPASYDGVSIGSSNQVVFHAVSASTTLYSGMTAENEAAAQLFCGIWGSSAASDGMTGVALANSAQIRTSQVLQIHTSATNAIYIGTNNIARIKLGTDAEGASTTAIYVSVNSTMQRVSVGASDSGGSGYRVLRIPN